MPLQRRVVDFYAERSIDDTMIALKEHYNIDQNRSSINTVGQQIALEAKHFNAEECLSKKGAEAVADTLIVQVDGSMIPIVDYQSSEPESAQSEASQTKQAKKTRRCFWKEIRLCTVRDFKSEKTTYGSVLGSPVEVGLMMEQCSKYRGLGEESWVHGVADGAAWIAEQYETIFGANHQFLIDFYHLMEYVSAAGEEIHKDLQARGQWRSDQKLLLLNNQPGEVITELKNWLLADGGQERVKVNDCLRYIENREDNLDYQTAKENDLPIGSGEVESSQKSVIQKRLKLTGAWWNIDHAENVVQLRVMRANNHYSKFWSQKSA